MSQIHWKSSTSADFNTAGDWSTGTVPGGSDDAILDAVGGAFTVSTSTGETVNSIQLASNATLNINARTFTATNGTGSGANAGAINIENNAYAALGGTVKNTGSITLDSVGNDTRLIINTAVSLTGGGKLTLTDNSANTVNGAAAATTLTNVDNTISGSGALGAGQLTFINQTKGVVNATGATALIINTGSQPMANAGLIEGTGAAGLTIQNTTVSNTGTLLGANGSAVNLQSADVQGGTLASAGTGVVRVIDRGTVLDGTTASITNAGVFDVTNNNYVYIQGVIANGKAGVINMQSTANDTRMIVTAANATLTGGAVILSDNTANTLQGTVSGPSGSQVASTLTNKSTISGAGTIGATSLTLINTKTIDATGANALIINVGGGSFASSSTVSNTGLLEATNPGALAVTGGLDLRGGTIAGGSIGVIEANGAATHVDLQGVTIAGGTLVTANGGVIETFASDRGSLLDGTVNTVNNTGVLNVTNNAWLYVQGAINNTGQINLQSTANDTRLRLSGATTLTGGGPLTLSDNANNSIESLSSATTLTNVSSTISGAGNLGNASLTFINDAAGVVNATGTINALRINTSGHALTNLGLIEATGVAGLTITSTAVDDTGGGTILSGAGSAVQLQSSTIAGGTLATTGSGVIQTFASDRGSLLDGATASLALSGTVDVTNNAWLYIQGTINNTGAINVQSSANDTRLRMNANTVLSGGGSVTLSDNTANSIDTNVAGSTLTNVSSTISGAGLIGGNNLFLVNDKAGVIDATGTNALTLATSNTVTNTGLIEATGAGGLLIRSSTIDDSTGGTITASAGSAVTLQSSTIVGGTLATTGSGVIQTFASDRGSLLAGATAPLVLSGTVDVTNNAWLYLQGTINNTGAINVQSTGNDTRLRMNANTVLSGGGSVTLSDSTANTIDTNVAGSTLTNVSSTISGAGTIGGNNLLLVNAKAGVIDATGVNALILATFNTVTNTGLIETTGAGGLLIRSTTVNGSTGGSIAAGNGSTVTVQSSTLVGGTLSSTGTGAFQINDRGSILDGTTSTINNAATFNVTNNNWLYIQGTINNTGSININSTGNDTRLRLNSNTTLTGNGVIFLNGSGANTFEGVTAGLTLTNNGNTLEGSGNLFGGNSLIFVNGKGGVVNANGTAALVLSTPGHTITNAGTLEGTGTGGLLITGATIVGTGGTLLAGAGSSVTLTSTTLTGGSMGAAATGQVTIGNSSTVTLDALASDAGTILLNSTGSVTSLILSKSTSLTGGGILELSANKNNIVKGSKGAVVLTNVNDTIEGGGKLGDNRMTLVNQAGGVINANSKVALTIGTGATAISNAGLIEASNKGKGIISSAITNTGTIEANGGTLVLQAAVTGTGVVNIASGTLEIVNASAAENVGFTGATGKLVLDQSQSYTGSVSGFSLKGKTSFDLKDVGFVSATEATFSGTKAGGVLTVTDGTHTAHINLVGNFLSSTFIASSDGAGGVIVVDPTAPSFMSTHAMVSAMAGLAGSSAGSGLPAGPSATPALQTLLTTPAHTG